MNTMLRRNQSLHIRVREGEKNRLLEIARLSGISVSKVARKAIKQFLKARNLAGLKKR